MSLTGQARGMPRNTGLKHEGLDVARVPLAAASLKIGKADTHVEDSVRIREGRGFDAPASTIIRFLASGERASGGFGELVETGSSPCWERHVAVRDIPTEDGTRVRARDFGSRTVLHLD